MKKAWLFRSFVSKLPELILIVNKVISALLVHFRIDYQGVLLLSVSSLHTHCNDEWLLCYTVVIRQIRSNENATNNTIFGPKISSDLRGFTRLW